MRKRAREIYEAAIAAVQPDRLIRKNLRMEGDELFAGDFKYKLEPGTQIFLLCVGKAAAAMAIAAEEILGEKIGDGLVLTKYDHSLPLKKLRIIEAGHPVPDENSRRGAEAILSISKQARPADIVVLLLSGGASALMSDLSAGIDVTEFDLLTKQLLNSGADIKELNTVRKHLSFLKGGQLARLVSPAKLVCLALSDVPGDAPDIIGSGPTVADLSTFADAVEVLKKYELWNGAGQSIKKRLQEGVEGRIEETPKPGDKDLVNSDYRIIGNNRVAVEAAAEKAKSLGYQTVISYKELSGEAAEQSIAFLEDSLSREGSLPLCVIAGGETTVTVKGSGKGGRNQQMALSSIAYAMKNQAALQKNWLLLAGSTDGTDGPTDAGGAFADTELINALKKYEVDPQPWLDNNDAYNFFKKYGGLLMTGPTQTNVMDILIVLRES
ncbi:glycerate kinase type-2 family protein [Pollutibacter soli]|uniref:glycerate kinase type-2 family protein n=1 Tax=Pollutibacter soli TaxID=3034157 RepID=UPI003013ECFE